jgi:hypothetical protein
VLHHKHENYKGKSRMNQACSACNFEDLPPAVWASMSSEASLAASVLQSLDVSRECRMRRGQSRRLYSRPSGRRVATSAGVAAAHSTIELWVTALSQHVRALGVGENLVREDVQMG